MGAALTGCWPAAPDGPSPLPLQKARGGVATGAARPRADD